MDSSELQNSNLASTLLQANIAQQGKQMRVGARKGFACHSVKVVFLAQGNRYEVASSTFFLSLIPPTDRKRKRVTIACCMSDQSSVFQITNFQYLYILRSAGWTQFRSSKDILFNTTLAVLMYFILFYILFLPRTLGPPVYFKAIQ